MATRGWGKIRSEAKFTCAHPKTIKDKEDAYKRTQVQFLPFIKILHTQNHNAIAKEFHRHKK
jgi:hypothetical protein